MNRRDFIKGTLMAGASLGLVGCGGLSNSSTSTTPRGKRPNVLFIPVDDLKPLLGCYGDKNVISPNIDALAARGRMFTGAHSCVAICGASRATVLTGLRPDTTHIWSLSPNMRKILPDVLTLPQYFKQNGYTSVGFGKVFHSTACDGAETQDVPSWSEPFRYCSPPSKPQKPGESRPRWPASGVVEGGDEDAHDGQIALHAVKKLEALAEAGNPFFLATGFLKPHSPFFAPKKYWDLYDRKQFKMHPFQEKPKGAPDFAMHIFGEMRAFADIPPTGPIPPDKQLELIHAYHACISYMDAQVGKLIAALKRLGLYDNTIICLWGDNGLHLGDHGLWSKHALYEHSTRVPLIFAGPGVAQPGKANHSPVELGDIFGTLCDLTSLPQPKTLECSSLMPMLRDAGAATRTCVMTQCPRQDQNRHIMGYAYRGRRYRYVRWMHMDYGKGERSGPVLARELYDYEKDPDETVNRIDAPEYADVVRTFEAHIVNNLPHNLPDMR